MIEATRMRTVEIEEGKEGSRRERKAKRERKKSNSLLGTGYTIRTAGPELDLQD